MAMYLSRKEVRALDREASERYGVPGVVLMENAGRGAAELLLSLGIHGPVVICCGKGNNGGDGFVIARHLHLVGAAVRVFLFVSPEQLSGEAAINYRIIELMKIPLTVVTQPKKDDLVKQFAFAEWLV